MLVQLLSKPSVIIFYNKGVGKTSILLRYTTNEFATEYHVTVGAEFGSKTLTLEGGHKVRLQIWDTVKISCIIVSKSYYHRLDKNLF